MTKVMDRARPGGSKLALGTAQWGMQYGVANRTGAPDRHAVADMLALAKESGVTQLDTARAYGQSEELIGALTEGDDHWNITTKLATDLFSPCLSTEQALLRTERSLSESRRALRREVLEVVLLHRFEHRQAYGGALWRALVGLRSQGGIGALGISARSPEEAWALLSDREVEVIQVASSLLDQRLYRSGFFRRAQELRKRVQVRSVFLQGVAHLSVDRLPRTLRPLARPLAQIGARAGLLDTTPRDLFLTFARALLPDATVLVGCERPVQLLQVLADWSAQAVGPDAVADLAAEIPSPAEDLLDPSRWGDGSRATEAPRTTGNAPGPTASLGPQSRMTAQPARAASHPVAKTPDPSPLVSGPASAARAR